jgi:hypothetical protein
MNDVDRLAALVTDDANGVARPTTASDVADRTSDAAGSRARAL